MFSTSTSTTKRSSFITHTAEHEQDYTIKVKSPSELLDLLLEFGLQATEQDITRPTATRTILLFECFILLLRPWRIPFIEAERAKVIKRSQTVTGAYETQIFAEANIIYQEFIPLLQQIRFSQFNMSDLLNPTSDRIVSIINAVANYAMYTELAWDFFGPLAENSDHLAVQATEAHEVESELQAKIEEKRLQLQEEEKEAKKLSGENEVLAAQVQAIRAESDELLKEKDKFKKTRSVLKDSLQEMQFHMLTIIEKRKKYKDRADFDTERVKESMAGLRRTNGTTKAERDQLKETIKLFDNELKFKRSVHTIITKLDQAITTISNINKDIDRHKKTNDAINTEILNLETALKDLQMRLTYLERNLEQTNLKIAHLEQQQDMKRESMKAFYEESETKSSKMDEFFQNSLAEAAEIDLEVKDLLNKVNALRIGHQKNMLMLEERCDILQSQFDEMHMKSQDINNPILS